MQTFLPYPDFDMTAKCLDWRRLGNQRNEAGIILKTIKGESSGWKNHAAVRMWRGYEGALELYLAAIIKEWIGRGYKNSIPIPSPKKVVLPQWIGDISFHSSHKSNLLRKNVEWYSRYGWKEPADLPYVWPA